MLVVDDSVVMRQLLVRLIGDEPDFEVAGIAADGRTALAKVESCAPGIVTLDVEMPGMGGLDVLSAICHLHPGLPVVMLSSATQTGAVQTVEALSRGAVGCCPKPTGATGAAATLEILRGQLLPLLRSLGRPGPAPRSTPVGVPRVTGMLQTAPLPPRRPAPRLVLIGSSTGGPHALHQILPRLPATLPVPVVVVQHMPALFTAPLANRLNETCALAVREAVDGEPLMNGTVYLAPGGRHLKLVPTPSGIRIRLDDGPPENSCRPAVDVLFRSAAPLFGPAVLGVILTGMGQDGLLGATELDRAGVELLVQDQASSVVWGMPGAIVRSGLPHSIVPLAGLAEAIADRLRVGCSNLCRPLSKPTSFGG
ncbi:MAG: chemotaxis response regulator protein-glutamate methylesterase [Acidobacteria bacterium]|nr:chemotaxis response regulator protein-glutamate methylesterase [Acidobacteriota bacterium]